MSEYRSKKGVLLHRGEPVDLAPVIEEFRAVLARTPAFRSKWTALAGVLLYQLEHGRPPTPPASEPPAPFVPPVPRNAPRQLCQVSGKRMFGSKGAARASNTSNGARLRVYHCNDCGSYHVTKADG